MTQSEAQHDNYDEGKEVVATVQQALTTITKQLSDEHVLCDHCAFASIFNNPKLLSNIRPMAPTIFEGIGGGITVQLQGDFGDFGTVAYDPRASLSLFTFCRVFYCTLS